MIEEQTQDISRHNLLAEQLQSLQRENEHIYRILAVDVWALAKTMDEFQPGFWSAFMSNREQALKRIVRDLVRNKPQDVKRPPFLK